MPHLFSAFFVQGAQRRYSHGINGVTP